VRGESQQQQLSNVTKGTDSRHQSKRAQRAKRAKREHTKKHGDRIQKKKLMIFPYKQSKKKQKNASND
jgi:hypothetical protein